MAYCIALPNERQQSLGNYQQALLTKPTKHFTLFQKKKTSLESELSKYISADELKYILTTKNKAVQLLSLQSKTLKELYANKALDNYSVCRNGKK
jgi:predicted membrane chloride channel (bestrophin family)